MSRVGKALIILDDKVSASYDESSKRLILKGVKNTLAYDLSSGISVKLEGKVLKVVRSGEEAETRALHGMYRALIQNGVIGLSKGFSKSLELQGVGYRASVSGKKLELSLGFSHPINYEIPEGIEIKVDKQTILHVQGADRARVGQVAAEIRAFRPPEPYLGKGVRYVGEAVRKKAGKSAGK